MYPEKQRRQEVKMKLNKMYIRNLKKYIYMYIEQKHISFYMNLCIT